MSQPRPSAETLEAALREMLIYLWGCLAHEYHYSRADPPERSMGCESVIERIHQLTALVGPVSAEQLSLPFLATGMYERVHAAMGIEADVPPELLNRARERAAGATYVAGPRGSQPWRP